MTNSTAQGAQVETLKIHGVKAVFELPDDIHGANSGADVAGTQIGAYRIVNAKEYIEAPATDGEALEDKLYTNPLRVHFAPDTDQVDESAMRRTVYAAPTQPSFISKREHPYLATYRSIAVRGYREGSHSIAAFRDYGKIPVLYEHDLVSGKSLRDYLPHIRETAEERVADLPGWIRYFKEVDKLGVFAYQEDRSFRILQILIECWRTVLWHIEHDVIFGCFSPDLVTVQEIANPPFREPRFVPKFIYRGVVPHQNKNLEVWRPYVPPLEPGLPPLGYPLEVAERALSNFLMRWTGLDPDKFFISWRRPGYSKYEHPDQHFVFEEYLFTGDTTIPLEFQDQFDRKKAFLYYVDANLPDECPGIVLSISPQVSLSPYNAS
ncbi:MAG: hypothetical protein NUW37_16605 [Planctomycetes bacterium]|nr:hypothetical protein [Planctomycetota bacterium]